MPAFGGDPSPAQLQSEAILDIAAQIYQKSYFETPGIDKLTWSPLVEIGADFG